MKILHMVPALNFGGVEMVTLDLVKSLHREEHQSYVMSSGGKLVEELHKLGIPHIDLPIHKKSPKSLALIPQIEGIINREKIDIVHAGSRIPAWLGYLASRRTDATFITTCHSYYSIHFFSQIMGWGKRVIVVSNTVGRHMMENFQVPFDRIRLVHNGIDETKIPFEDKCLKMEKKNPKGKFVIANIARITPIKGHRDFLKAVRLAKRRFPTLETWLIGSYEGKQKYFEELEGLIEKLGLKDSVKFLGARSDIPELLKEIDLIVLSTTVPEGFGRVLIEAGAAGVPVIATKVGGVLDIIEDGKDGCLVPPNEPLKMSEAIIEVLSSYSDKKSMIQNFRKKIEEQFTLQRVVEDTLAVYQDALDKKKILVMKLGALGDLILIVPSLKRLRKKYPNAQISLLVGSDLAPLLEDCPHIDELITFERGKRKNFFKRLISLIKNLRQQHFDISIDFQNNKWTHLIAYFADVRKRYGYIRGFFGRLLTNGLVTFKDKLPPVEHQLKILNLLGIQEMDDTLELWTQEEDIHRAKQLLSEAWVNPSQPLVGFVLNASERWITKSWPLENYIALGERLETELNVRIVLIGDSSNKRAAEKFMILSNTEAINLVGKTSLREWVALISQMSCLVSGDTAPIHVASAVGTESLVFFGPTDPKRHAPPGKNSKILKADMPCSPCYRTQCNQPGNKKGKPVCMEKFGVDEVFEIVKTSFNQDRKR